MWNVLYLHVVANALQAALGRSGEHFVLDACTSLFLKAGCVLLSTERNYFGGGQRCAHWSNRADSRTSLCVVDDEPRIVSDPGGARAEQNIRAKLKQYPSFAARNMQQLNEERRNLYLPFYCYAYTVVQYKLLSRDSSFAISCYVLVSGGVSKTVVIRTRRLSCSCGRLHRLAVDVQTGLPPWLGQAPVSEE